MESVKRLVVFFALVAGASASTPPGFKPENSGSLTPVFGTTEATNGVNIPVADTASAPSIYSPSELSGQYTLMMVDPDAPNGGFLHWLQALTPSSSKGSYGYQLNVDLSATAEYAQPSPPFAVPFTHRYVLLLLNTTDIGGAGSEGLDAASQTRSPWDTSSILSSAGIPVVGSTWFNVTNAQALASGSATLSGTSPTAAAPSPATSTATSTGSGSGSGSSTVTSASSTKTSTAASTSTSVRANNAVRLTWDTLLGFTWAAAWVGLL